MGSSSDSSFSFRIRERHQFDSPVQPPKKIRVNTVKAAVLHIETQNLPLISSSTSQFCESLFLEPYKPYTIGRKLELCDFAFADSRVSRWHCQLYFDSLEKKIYLSDGLILGCTGNSDSLSRVGAKISTNGVFLNGFRINGVVELQVGDVVELVCRNKEACGLGSSIGFLVKKAVFMEEVDCRNSVQLDSCNLHSKRNSFTLKCCRVTDSTNVLLSRCRDILCSDDPVYYIRKFDTDQKKRIHLPFEDGFKEDDGVQRCSSSGLQIGCPKRKRVYSRDVEAENCQSSQKEIAAISEENAEHECSNFVSAANTFTASKKCNGIIDVQHAYVSNSNFSGFSLGERDSNQSNELLDAKNCGGCILPPGKKFYLNRLQFRGQDNEEIVNVVSLPELLHPIESLERVFIATFTSDILWFLNYCKIPQHLPVTIACHSAERCWSVDPDKRTSVPFTDYPNLTVVYPPFPEVIAFSNDRRRSGIACHHPKLIVLQREDKLRVVISSANLVEKQWRDVTNTVWWQDFPRLNTPNCLSLFTRLSVEEINIDSTKCDFAAQLAGFMASLVADVPAQASWILELIKYDFSGAAGYLVASVPGIHSQRSPVYESKNLLVGNEHELSPCSAKFLSSVETSVVGLSHIYRSSKDSNGEHLKKLVSFLGQSRASMDGMSEVILRRITNIPADRNAVSVLVPNPEDSSVGDFAQLGFLPRNVAKWVAPLSDTGNFAFSAFIHPKEVRETALEQSSKEVKLILYAYAGSSFSAISEVSQLEYASAICSLVASSQRYAGLWRLKEVLGLHKWPEHLQSEFIFGSSSVGAINAQFLAAFAAAAGKTSVPYSDSEESDPDWGCWSVSQELKNPSIRIIFPSIERVKTNKSGILASRRLLCFSQKTWQRLENTGILHDAIPHPSERVGFPMHVKVGRRRFLSKDGSSFGWVYSGSHDFSAAAWGRPLSNGNTRNNSVLGSRLHISNYELGIVFIVPPPDAGKENIENLDAIVLPFVVPPPKYTPRDRPATAQAIRESLVELSEQEKEAAAALSIDSDCVEEGVTAEEEEDEVVENLQFVTREKEDEKSYADELWSQVDSSQSC